MPDQPSPILPPRVKDITDQRFGRLVAKKFIRKDNRRRAHWQFQCDCGALFETRADSVTSERTESCGCLNRENHTTHGLSRKDLPIYRCWTNMRNRCQNEKHKAFKHYGGRGITVCERWEKFEYFLEDMGPTWKRGLSIDRKENDGNYEPGNCRWATAKQQRHNQ